MVTALLLSTLRFFELLLFLRVIMSWFPNMRGSSFGVLIDSVTEPVMRPVRELISYAMGGKQVMLDFSPIVVFVIIDYILIPLISAL